MLTRDAGLRLLRLVASITLVGIGVWVLVQGVHLELKNPRTNEEDNIAWAVLALGAFLFGIGASIPFTRMGRALLIGVAAPFVGFAVLVAIVWGYIILYALFKATFG